MSMTEHAPASLSGASRLWPLCGLALAVGLAGGAAQSVLPGGWNTLANSAAPLVMVAFLIGLRAPGHRRGRQWRELCRRSA